MDLEGLASQVCIRDGFIGIFWYELLSLIISFISCMVISDSRLLATDDRVKAGILGSDELR